MKPILCIIDLTESSAIVLQSAGRLADAFKTNLIIVFPYRLIDQAYASSVSELKSKLEDDAKARFELLRQQGDFVAHLSYVFRPEIGFTSDRIASYLKAKESGMIVIGQQQATDMNERDTTTLQHLITMSNALFTIVPETFSL